METWKPRIPWLVVGAIAVFSLVVAVLDQSLVSYDPNPEPLAHPLDLYDDNGNGRITCAEARKHGIAPVPRSHPAYKYMRDGDNDGVVCE